MLWLLQRILLSKRLKKIFDIIFDLAIMLSITWLAIVIITSIFEPIFGHYTDIFTTIINQKKAIAVSLNTLILVKIYKVLHHFIWDHHIKLIDLIEIAITSIVIKMVFDLNYSRESIVLVIILLSFFVILNYAQKKNLLVDEETYDI
jgi:uncharacterized membrane protein (DUF373 family)